MNGITIALPKQKKEQLSRLARRYGLSLPEFSRRVLEELSSEFPQESFADYNNPDGLHLSFNKALLEWKTGRVYEKL